MDKYISAAFQELYQEDGLLVMARGLGLTRLISKFIQYYSNPANYSNADKKEKKLVFCINATGLEDVLIDSLLAEGIPASHLPRLITNEIPANDRIDMYLEGGCFIITSRILIVDLLDEKVDVSNICGLLVPNAHKISDLCVESFIIRVFREKNRSGFLKAFSDDPESLQQGFAKVERIMKYLYVKRLYLWPRFQMMISNVLSKSQPDVIELTLNMPKNMEEVQKALLVAMNQTINELKKAAPKVETTGLSLENGLFSSFDIILRRQLDPEWHRLSSRTKQLVFDLTTLRQLLDYLLRYDAFSFYSYLITLKNASSQQNSPSYWILSEAADRLFSKARDRLFLIVPVNKKEQNIDDRDNTIDNIRKKLKIESFIKENCERPPKWKLLMDILEEIKIEYLKTKTATSSKGRVMIVVKDERTSHQIRDCILHGVELVVDHRFRWFISQEAANIKIKARSSKINVKQTKSNSNNNKTNAASKPNDVDSIDNDPLGIGLTVAEFNLLSLENKLLLLHELELKKVPSLKRGRDTMIIGDIDDDKYNNESENEDDVVDVDADPDADEDNDKDNDDGIQAKEFVVEMINDNKKRKTTNNKSSTSSKSTYQKLHIQRSKTGLYENFNTLDKDELEVLTEKKMPNVININSDHNNNFGGDGNATVTRIDPNLHLIVISHTQFLEKFNLLNDMKPDYIVLYDPDVTVVRTIETYQADNNTKGKLKVYFMLYTGSAEEHRYVGALAKEKKAFEALINGKEHMVISIPDLAADLQREKEEDNLTTIIRGLKKDKDKGPRNVVVDVREFRSSLPSLLHLAGGFKLIPRTLAVADFVLAPEICIERKGISDLFQSFASGRLYNQVETMSRYYQYPSLLIEFQAEKSFSLQSVHEISAEVQTNSVTTKIMLLVLAFPHLKILWSRSPHATTEIFRAVMSNHEQADVDKAVSVGSALQSDRDQTETDIESRLAAMEILMSLPGINPQNYYEITKNVENIAELSQMSETMLTPLIGPINAKKLVTFFKQRN